MHLLNVLDLYQSTPANYGNHRKRVSFLKQKVSKQRSSVHTGQVLYNEQCHNDEKIIELGIVVFLKTEVKAKTVLSNICNNKVGINKDNYLNTPFYVSMRNDHKNKVHEYRPRTCMFANSFFPKCIAEGNKLSEEQVCCINEDLFVSLL